MEGTAQVRSGLTWRKQSEVCAREKAFVYWECGGEHRNGKNEKKCDYLSFKTQEQKLQGEKQNLKLKLTTVRSTWCFTFVGFKNPILSTILLAFYKVFRRK